MNIKIKVLAAAVGLGLGMTSLQASAGITWYSPFTLFQDDNIDFYLDQTGDNAGRVLNTTASRTGTLDVGDVTVSVFELNETVRVIPSGASAPITGGELTGIVANQVLTKIEVVPGLFSYTFGPVQEGLDAILIAAGIDPVLAGSGVGGGAHVAMWFDTSPDLDVLTPTCLNLFDCMRKAADGLGGADIDSTLWEVDGFTLAEVDDFWTAQGGADIGAIATSISQNLAQIQYGLDGLFNGTGQTLLPVPCAPNAKCTDGSGDESVILLGGGSLHGGAGLESIDAFARSDFDFTKSVPEPATLALLGMGLLGMGAGMRKRKA